MTRKEKSNAPPPAAQTAMTQRAGTRDIQSFGSHEIATTGETVASVLAARAKAEVEARFIVAMHPDHKRNWDSVRAELLKACDRPGFAGSATEKVWGAAWFHKPIGDGVDGFTIRFAEEAMRSMGNLDARSSILWEDDNKRLVQIEVLDLENNISIPTVIVVSKTIERTFLKEGEVAISTRMNSQNKPVYLRAATDDEVLQKQNSAVSKALRNGIMRLLPGDIQAECRDRILQIRHGDIATDPDGAKKKIVDSFAALNVGPKDLQKYLSHDLGICSPHEIAALRDLYAELRDGKTTWHKVMAAISAERGEMPPAEGDEPPQTGVDRLKNKLKADAPPKKKRATKKEKEAEKKAKEKKEKSTGPTGPTPEEFEQFENGVIDKVANATNTPPKTTPPPAFDVTTELAARAKEKFGKQTREELGKLAKEQGFKLSNLTDEQASALLDILDNSEV